MPLFDICANGRADNAEKVLAGDGRLSVRQKATRLFLAVGAALLGTMENQPETCAPRVPCLVGTCKALKRQLIEQLKSFPLKNSPRDLRLGKLVRQVGVITQKPVNFNVKCEESNLQN